MYGVQFSVGVNSFNTLKLTFMTFSYLKDYLNNQLDKEKTY